MEVREGHKRCSKCGEVKALVEFSMRESGRLRADCKACCAARTQAWYWANLERARVARKAYGIKHTEKKAIYDREYRDANRERLARTKKDWLEANKDQIRIQQRGYREANKETIAAQRKIYRANKRVAKSVYDRDYREVNRERLRDVHKAYLNTPVGRASKKAIGHRHRVRGQFAFEELVTKLDLLRWEKEGATCYLTGRALLPEEVTWDHVVPLYFGGTNDRWNFLATSKALNSGKKNKIVWFEIETRKPHYTLDPCPGGPTWPRIPLTQPTLDEMQAMCDAWKARRQKEERHAA